MEYLAVVGVIFIIGLIIQQIVLFLEFGYMSYKYINGIKTRDCDHFITKWLSASNAEKIWCKENCDCFWLFMTLVYIFCLLIIVSLWPVAIPALFIASLWLFVVYKLKKKKEMTNETRY